MAWLSSLPPSSREQPHQCLLGKPSKTQRTGHSHSCPTQERFPRQCQSWSRKPDSCMRVFLRNTARMPKSHHQERYQENTPDTVSISNSPLASAGSKRKKSTMRRRRSSPAKFHQSHGRRPQSSMSPSTTPRSHSRPNHAKLRKPLALQERKSFSNWRETSASEMHCSRLLERLGRPWNLSLVRMTRSQISSENSSPTLNPKRRLQRLYPSLTRAQSMRHCP
mmetsp:Transcript_5971/g.11656  ORF Transcript_5971/g.11656 Transcript_5971/m.11656 type:complete len:222 (-) Transcript_5971:533-1198(-)